VTDDAVTDAAVTDADVEYELETLLNGGCTDTVCGCGCVRDNVLSSSLLYHYLLLYHFLIKL